MRTMTLVLATICALGACKKDESAAKAPAPSAPLAPPATAGQRIEVKVTKDGYVPDKIAVAASQEVTLVFTRTDDVECGAEVVIPSLNVKKSLPLNQPVEIAFKSDKAGEVPFTCGMDMYKGALVVQ
jgi:plastocyanin domain-containing protein